MTEPNDVRAIALDTLQTLRPFTLELQKLSDEAALSCSSGDLGEPFKALVDAIAIFSDSLKTARRILQLHPHGVGDLMETQLLELLQDLLKEREQENLEALTILLEFDLPNHFEQWRETALPALITTCGASLQSPDSESPVSL